MYDASVSSLVLQTTIFNQFLRDEVIQELDFIDAFQDHLSTQLLGRGHLGNKESESFGGKSLDFLAYNLVAHFLGFDKDLLKKFFKSTHRGNLNTFLKHDKILLAIFHTLLEQEPLNILVNVLESGAVAIDKKEFAPWMSLPFQGDHQKFAILLAFLAYLHPQNDEYKSSIKKIAIWQLNLLDFDFSPIGSIFTPEKESNTPNLRFLNYVFFKAAAIVTKDSLFASCATKLFQVIRRTGGVSEVELHPLWHMFDQIFSHSFSSVHNETHPLNDSRSLLKNDSAELSLSKQIKDSSSAMLALRSEKRTIYFTLHGQKSTLGFWREGSLKLLSYGPQQLPLDCIDFFGIEGNHFSDSGLRQTYMQVYEDSFSIKGCVKSCSQEPFKSTWFDISQSYESDFVMIEATPITLDNELNFAFSFFFQASECLVDGKKITMNDLDSLEGVSKSITLKNNSDSLTIETANEDIKVRVVPLGASGHYWGANFLIAYILPAPKTTYKWTVKSSQLVENL